MTDTDSNYMEEKNTGSLKVNEDNKQLRKKRNKFHKYLGTLFAVL